MHVYLSTYLSVYSTIYQSNLKDAELKHTFMKIYIKITCA